MSRLTFLGFTQDEVGIHVTEDGKQVVRRYQAAPGQGLGVVLSDPYSETDHDMIPALLGKPMPLPVAIPAGPGNTTGARMGSVVDEVLAALANDGKVDEYEAKLIAAHAMAHLGAPAIVGDLLAGKLSVDSVIASVKGMLHK